ncbi:hypothetical protein DFS34DRAFT_61196 [Phlyctochytrium arcticum]|nr:hypothetical protein DFS34DRAFT_61196 [Phlyctochytrium arcticum]
MVVAELKPLAFEIAACTSFDEECPPQELLLEQHGPNARGWQSERFCTWPQVIVLKTRVGNSRIRKVQTLVHHFKIPTRLEFYVGKTAGERQMSSNGSNSGDTAGYRDAQPAVEFTRLGYVALNDNEQIGYKARELKEIHIDAEGEYLKIVAHKCYVNNLNLYNQVGIVAVTLFGEPANIDYMLKSLDSRQEALLGLDPAEEYSNIGIPHDNEHAALWGMINRSSTNRRISATKDLGFEGILDDKMRTLVNAISVAKEAAVREERFADAKALKMISDQCREVCKISFVKRHIADQKGTFRHLKSCLSCRQPRLVRSNSKITISLGT